MSTNEFSHQTVLDGHTAAVTALEFSPDGRFLASAGDDGVVLIFSTSSWMPVDRFVDVSPVSALAWHGKGRYLLFCGHQSGDLHVLTMSRSMKCTVIQTSKFGGRIYSLSLSPTSSRIAIAYANEIALTDVIRNPYRLKDNREYLPKPPSPPHGSTKLPGPIAKSLQFTKRKNYLVATYAGHGIVVWDTYTMTIAGHIVPRTFPIGTSIIAADDDIMAVSNLINGVDWYSLSDLAFLSTTKLPAGVVFSPLSAPTRFEDGVSVIIGGTNGSVHILGRDKDLLSLEQNGDHGTVQSVAFAPAFQGRALIAMGTDGSHGRATVVIWAFVDKKAKRRIPLITFRSIIPTGLTWNQIATNGALLFLCFAWLVHFLTEDRRMSTLEQPV